METLKKLIPGKSHCFVNISAPRIPETSAGAGQVLQVDEKAIEEENALVYYAAVNSEG